MPLDSKTGEHDLSEIFTLELLFRTEVEFVMNTARRCGLSDADAEDVTQQVFLVLQRRLHSLHSPDSLRPWLVAVTRKTARALRAERAGLQEEPPYNDFGDIEDDFPLPDEQVLLAERKRELYNLVETIESSRRIVFVLHVLDELPMSEVAQTLGIPVPTAYNRLRLARYELQEAIHRKQIADEFLLFYRTWDGIKTVRDPSEAYYGRGAITAETRDRMWAFIFNTIAARFGSIEQAEVDGLRVRSAIFLGPAPVQPYPKIKRKRRPRVRKTETTPEQQRLLDSVLLQTPIKSSAWHPH